MSLREWRLVRKLGLAETARALGISGVNPGGTLARIEVGSRQPDADMIERIVILTGGAVSADDMHSVRLGWLKTNRPEKFLGVEPVAFAAEASAIPGEERPDAGNAPEGIVFDPFGNFDPSIGSGPEFAVSSSGPTAKAKLHEAAP